MEKHVNYYSIEAENNYEFGFKLGKIFGKSLREEILKQKKLINWQEKIQRSIPYFEVTKKEFPQYIEELKGYAESSGVDFLSLWVLALEDEIKSSENCTSIVVNRGLLIAHNEDWEASAKNNLSVLRKKIGKLIIFELFYSFSLGGSSISINSNGYLQAINTLTHGYKQIGIPKNIIARWMSETDNPEENFERMKKITRASGYSHTLISKDGKTLNIESTAREQVLLKPELPFIHTNHFLSSLKNFDKNDTLNSSISRYKFAKENVVEKMKEEDLRKIVSNASFGKNMSVFNERTIGRMIVDLNSKIAKVWLLREKKRGWVDYPLDIF
jgi:isopenicillin-N N-acyltransferase-like protein